MEKIIIPESLHIVLDDLGWFNGKDDRENGGPSRTGMPRRHCPADYRAVDELGRRIGMKINCAFVIGEWDPDNRLRAIPNLSKYGDGWDNASYYDENLMRECIEIIDSSDYIDFTVHGLLHGNYRNPSDAHNCSDFYFRLNGETIMINEPEIRQRLDAYFELARYQGITKKIDSFVPPCFCYRRNELSRILADYGIKFISTTFRHDTVRFGDDKVRRVLVENGLINLERNNNFVPWYAVAYDPSRLPPLTGIMGIHWVNILHIDPDKNGESVEKWVQYFTKCANTYGIVLSDCIEFAATHSLYRRYAKHSYEDGVLTVNVSDVPDARAKGDSFVVSSLEPITSYSGCKLELYQDKGRFKNYKVTPTEEIITLKA